MKLLIISAGPGINEIRNIYGHAIDWISSFLTDSFLDIDINHIYKNENFDHSKYDAWIITGSASSVGHGLDFKRPQIENQKNGLRSKYIIVYLVQL